MSEYYCFPLTNLIISVEECTHDVLTLGIGNKQCSYKKYNVPIVCWSFVVMSSADLE